MAIGDGAEDLSHDVDGIRFGVTPPEERNGKTPRVLGTTRVDACRRGRAVFPHVRVGSLLGKSPKETDSDVISRTSHVSTNNKQM